MRNKERTDKERQGNYTLNVIVCFSNTGGDTLIVVVVSYVTRD
jgi:hypothetical protein